MVKMDSSNISKDPATKVKSSPHMFRRIDHDNQSLNLEFQIKKFSFDREQGV